MAPGIAVALVFAALVCAFIGFAASADPEGRGARLMVRWWLAALGCLLAALIVALLRSKGLR